MKTIVTIDFDIMMGPSIDLYNDAVPGRSWEELNNISPYYNILTIDTVYYQKILNYILQLSRTLEKNQFFFIHSHENIARSLEDQAEQFQLFNIDHHHDICYRPEDDDKFTCANWVQGLMKGGLCTSYTWIHNYNSIMPFDSYLKFLNKDYVLSDFNLDSLPQPDKVILCLSEPWVPPMYRNLFYIYLDILNEIYDTHFDFID